MPFGRLIENKIHEAIERGEFDNLPGKGKPLDLTEYFNTPSDLRLGYAMLKSTGHVPIEVELRHEIEALEARLAACTDARQCEALRREINGLSLKLKLMTDSSQRPPRRR
jgi:hypothetical protein